MGCDKIILRQQTLTKPASSKAAQACVPWPHRRRKTSQPACSGLLHEKQRTGSSRSSMARQVAGKDEGDGACPRACLETGTRAGGQEAAGAKHLVAFFC